MPANIDTFAAGRNMPAWHRLGTVVEDLMTVPEALELAQLSGWDVRKEPLTIMVDGEQFTLPDQFVNTRVSPHTNEREPLAIVGNRYKPVQNEEVFALGDGLLDMGGAQVDTAGALDGGCTVFGTFLLPDSIVIDEQGIADRVDRYLLVASSHDGTMQTTAGITNVRVVCQNTLTISLKGMTNKYKVRHTKNAESSLIEARNTLKMAYEYNEQFEAEAKSLFETPADSNTFDSIIEAAFGERPDDDIVATDDGDTKNKAQSRQTRWDNRRDVLHEIRRGETVKGIRDTAWGAFNAIEEYFDYYRQTRGDDTNLYTAHLDMSGGTVRKKSQLFEAVKEVAGV